MNNRNLNSRKTNKYNEALSACTKSLNLLGCATVKSHVKFLSDQERKLRKQYGPNRSVKILQAYFLETQRFSLGVKVEPLIPFWVRRKNGFPCFLYNQFSKELNSNDRLEKLKILSLLRCYEAITLEPDSDLKTITEPSKGREFFYSIQSDWELFLNKSHFCDKLKINFQEQMSKRRTQNSEIGTELHYSTKAGVAGKACVTAGTQSLLIKEEMLAYLSELNNIFERRNWINILKSNQEFHLNNIDMGKANSKITTLGKLSKLSAPGGKTRVIAIGNYWVQNSLLQLHRELHTLLSKMDTDSCYNQTDSFDWVLKTSSIKPMWSYDLSAATDRFPVELQVSFLKHLDTNIGTLWDKILKELTFYHDGDEITYNVGQPMGLYSSWATFSLTHHTLVQYCAWKLRKRYPFKDYRILGDDIVIADKDVAELYGKMLTSFDVKINHSKSFVPSSLSGPCIAEFAKRVSDKGIEMTPIPPTMCIDAWRNFAMIPDHLYWLESRGYALEQVPVSRILSISGFTRNYRKYLVCLIHIWGLLRHPIFKGLTETYPSLDNIIPDKLSLLKLRLEILEEKTRMFADIFTENSQQMYLKQTKDDIENTIGLDINDEHYFYQICKTRLKQLERLIEEFETIIDKFYDDESDDAIVTKVSELEYIPRIDFESLVDSINAKNYSSQKQKISEYLAEIASELDLSEIKT